MDDPLGVDEVKAGDEFAPDAGRLRFGEVLLAPDAFQQLAAFQKFHDDVRVSL